MDKFFSKPYFEIWLKQASPEIKKWFQEEIDYLKRDIKPDSKILDVGCGFGRHIKVLAPFSEEVVGVDNNGDMLNKAKQNLSNFKNIKLFIQDAQKLEFDDASFDYIICMTNTFGTFLNKKQKILREMKKVLKQNGKIIISVYSEKATNVRIKNYEKVGLHIEKMKDGKIYLKEGHITEQFSNRQLVRLFESVGLKVNIIELTPISYLCIATKP